MWSKSHLINIARDTSVTLITDNSKDFISSVPEMGMKIHIFISINHHITLWNQTSFVFPKIQWWDRQRINISSSKGKNYKKEMCDGSQADSVPSKVNSTTSQDSRLSPFGSRNHLPESLGQQSCSHGSPHQGLHLQGLLDRDLIP